MTNQELIKEIAGVIKKTFDNFELNHERIKSGWDRCVELLRGIIVNKLSNIFEREDKKNIAELKKIARKDKDVTFKVIKFNPSQFKKECGVE